MSPLCEVEGAVYISVVLNCQEMARGSCVGKIYNDVRVPWRFE